MAKTKNTQPYFPHDANNRNKMRMLKLRKEHGAEGYGIYIMLMERLRSADGFKEELDYELLAYDLRCDQQTVESVINDFGIFEVIEDGKMFHSPELTDSMLFMEEQRQRRVEAARRAAEARWGKKAETVETPTDVEINPSTQNIQEPPAAVAAPSVSLAAQQTSAQERGVGMTLEEEVSLIKVDKQWVDSVQKGNNLDKTSIERLFTEFISSCRQEGKKRHQNIVDAKSHFSRWVKKRIAAEAANASSTAEPKKPIKKSSDSALLESVAKSNREIAERQAEQANAESSKVGGYYFHDLYGYPHDENIANVMNPDWRKANPPSRNPELYKDVG